MEEETSDPMDLDLNWGPVPEAGSGSISTEAVNLDDWVDNPLERIREAVRHRRWRWQQVQIPTVTENISMELVQSLRNLGNIGTLQAGEGSVAAEERINDVSEMCENNNGFMEEDNVSEEEDDDGSILDCNICLDLAKDPVVTCCGHLFCWSCLYRWLNVHSNLKECPVCKGEVTTETVTPIYGRGNASRGVEDDSGLEIPPRPHARRVESFRQTIRRTAFSLPVEEMFRRLGSRLDLTRDLTPPRDANGAQESTESTNSFINRIFTSRGMHAEQDSAVPLEDANLTQGSTAGPEGSYPALLRRRQAHWPRAARMSWSSVRSSAERYFEHYLRNPPTGRNQEQAPVDDRDSFSSIAAMINSESQMDTAVEIDSVVSLSSSTSRRRNDPSRVSDVDSGDSRAPRRRRLH